MGTGSSRDNIAIRKMMNPKGEGGQSKNTAGRSNMRKGIGNTGEDNEGKGVVFFLLSVHMCQ
jgi:hypothetical protein